MRKISIRFETGSFEEPEFLVYFFLELGLDPQRWLQEQEVELPDITKFSLFRYPGMKIPFPEELQNLKQWVCRLEERDKFLVFWVGGYAWAAQISPSFPSLINLLYLRPIEVLTYKFLWKWNSLSDLSSLNGLHSLTSLDLRGCEILSDLSPLSGLSALRTLDLKGCRSLSDLKPLSGLHFLTSLDLRRCDALNDLGPLSGLQALTSLDLSECDALNDLSPLSGLQALTSLNLRKCDALNDLGPLSGLQALTSLNLSGWDSFSDLKPLSGLLALTSLDLSTTHLSGRRPSDLSPLSGLQALTSLNLTGWDSFSDLSPLSGLSALTTLKFGGGHSLNDLSPLSGLHTLTNLHGEHCSSLKDLSPLSGLHALTSLELSCCTSLSDLGPLSGLHALTSLDFSNCTSLSDLSPLSGLSALTTLKLRNCALSDLSPLIGLPSLSSLDLDGNESIISLSPLANLPALRSLEFDSLRVKSIEPLRGISSLRELSKFNPPEVAELLAHAAFLRRDHSFIEEHGSSWLAEAEGWQDGPPDLQDRFAATLGDGFSLLVESEVSAAYSEFLAGRPDFSVAPWKAWLGGTLRESGCDLYRSRVERMGLEDLLPSAVGGVCATLPREEDPGWSRDWLAALEKARLADAKALLRVAPEICLAHARLGEMGGLGRWLAHFTDPSDPAALDPLQAALAQFQLASGKPEAAENHLFAIQSPAFRDPVLEEWVTAIAETDLEQASAKLLLIEDPARRRELAQRLAAKPGATEATLQRLVVAVGDSPEALAGVISQLPDPKSKALLQDISEALQPSRQKTLLQVADDLHREAERLRAAGI